MTDVLGQRHRQVDRDRLSISLETAGVEQRHDQRFIRVAEPGVRPLALRTPLRPRQRLAHALYR